MGNAAPRSKPQKDPCNRLVNWSIAGLILTNILFLGQKIPVPSWIAKPVIQAQLRTIENVLESWLQQNGHYPETLGEMMASPAVRAMRPSFYDIAGNRLQYIRLGLDAFILRSFGSDSIPASSSGDHDDVILESTTSRNSGGMILSAPTHLAPAGLKAPEDFVEFATWPPAATDGLWSPDGKWIARIATNPNTGEHRIIVLKDDHSRMLVSPHERVEEFFWETGPELSLIFSATGSDLYDDGIFRWRLSASELGDSPQMENLLGEVTRETLPGRLETKKIDGQKPRWVIALLQGNNGVSIRNGFAAIAVQEADLIAPGSNKKLLDPNNLWFCPGDSGHCSREKSPRGKRVTFRLALDQSHKIRGRVTPAQELWNRLPVRGSSQELLESWFAAASSPTLRPLQPYVLFYAILLQDQVRASDLGKGHPATERKLAEWTNGMTEKLVQSQETPRYLQALIVGSDRASLKSKGNDSHSVFELTDIDLMETTRNVETKKKQSGPKTRQ